MNTKVTLNIELTKAEAVTLCSIIAEGINRGSRHGLPRGHGAEDAEIFDLIAPDMLAMGRELLDAAMLLEE